MYQSTLNIPDLVLEAKKGQAWPVLGTETITVVWLAEASRVTTSARHCWGPGLGPWHQCITAQPVAATCLLLHCGSLMLMGMKVSPYISRVG